MSTVQTRGKTRGFASMTSEKQREIASKGGRAAHARGTAHEFTQAEARAAGKKGGESVSSNRAHMSHIGRLGGKSSAGKRATSEKSADLANAGDTVADAGSHNGDGTAVSPAASSAE